jgi:hypothetical protein
MIGLSTRGLVGIVLMIVGAVAFLPGLSPAAGGRTTFVLLPAAVLLTLGTYLVGTDVGGGRPV